MVVKWETVYFFILCAHIQYTYIYLYHNLRNQKVEFLMESLFFNNQLFLNVIRTIILYSYCRAFGGGEGEDALGILFLLFFQGFILDCFVFFLAISVLLASVLSLTVAKIWYVAKIVKQNISSFCKLLCDLDCGFIIPFQLINDKHPQLVESIS